LKNVLLDKHVTYLAQEEYSKYVKEYTGTKYSVGVDIKGTSFDENCADFCIRNECDFLTTDKKSYDHFFKIKKIKSVEIFQFLKNEPVAPKTNPRPIYCMRYNLI